MATEHELVFKLETLLFLFIIWDGYPQWLGRILNTHYTTKSQVIDLIDGGDMSSCWTDTVWGEQRTDGQKYGPETYAARGEDCPPRLDESITEFINDGEEFGYVFKDGEWFCYDTKTWSDTFAQVIDIPEGFGYDRFRKTFS